MIILKIFKYLHVLFMTLPKQNFSNLANAGIVETSKKNLIIKEKD